ncbi:MAG: SprB repeat-containing protein [Saprospiraceae bacterium]|nr:SprB repeat-containing protein [Saprospiraceae bacterium]
MRKTQIISVLFLICFLSWAGITSTNLTTGYTAAPGEGSCAGCHNYNGVDLTGSINISGLPQYLISDNWYDVSVSIYSSSPDGYYTGFQLTAVDVAGNNFGLYSNPGNYVEFANIGNRNYAQHNAPWLINFSTQTNTYTFKWKSPPVADNETVQFYYTGTIGIDDGEAGSFDLALGNNLTRTVVAPVGFSSINKQNVSCYGASDGVITIFPQGGLAPITYQWSNGASGNSLSGLAAGVYAVTISDQLGQTAQTSVTIQQPTAINAAVFESQPIDCAGNETGSLQIAAFGGTPPYTYLWTGGISGPINPNLGTGLYTVTLSDSNGCTFQENYFLDEPDDLEIILFNQQNVSCFGASDGLIQITATGGTPPYQFNWSSGSSNPALQNLSAGNYTMSITDQHGCSQAQTFVITEPDVVVVDIESIGPSNFNNASGYIDINVEGGTPPYSFSWTGGDLPAPVETEDLLDIFPGTYYLDLIDANGCEIEVGPLVVETLIHTTEFQLNNTFYFQNPVEQEINLQAVLPFGENNVFRLFSPTGLEINSGILPVGLKQAIISTSQYSGLAYLEIRNSTARKIWPVLLIK